MDNYENKEQQNHHHYNACNWKKVALISLMVFLGSFLAFYVLVHQTMMHFFKPAGHYFHKQEQQFLNDFDKDFKKMKKMTKMDWKKAEEKISAIQTVKNENEYVIVIDLKKFNNDERNITFDVNGKIITISGNVIKNNRNSQNSYYFTESFEIPEKIDKADITKERVKNNYIITIPVEN